VYEGACRLPELPEEFEGSEEPELVEPEPVVPLPDVPLPEVPLPDVPLPDDELPVRDAALELDELFDEVTVLWAEPGSTTATTPAVTTLAKLTVAVVAVSRRRPRSRSAMARERLRAAAWRDTARPRDDPSRSSWLLMSPVWHAQL
jgi:hypothetical protein